MAHRLKMTVPGRPEYVGTVRIAVSHAASRAGFDIEALEDIKVAVSEACTNIICHAHVDSDYSYDVTLELHESKITISIQDSGAGFGMEDYVEPDPSEAKGSGLGIFIIRALMDEVEIQSELGSGTDIRMTKYLKQKPV